MIGNETTRRKLDRLSPSARLALAVFHSRAAARRRGAPGSVFLGLTGRCGLACLHCKYRGRPAGPDMPYALARAALRGAAALGAPKVVFFGGEPLLYPRLEALTGEAAALGLFTELDTNGQDLTPARARRLARAGLASVMISLHAPSAAGHDRLAGPGSFAGARRAVAAALRAGLIVYISSCVFSPGAGGALRGLLSFARRTGAHGARLLPYSPPAGSSRLPGALATALRRADPDGFAGTCLTPGRGGCAAQHAEVLYIAPDGALRACPYAARRLGTFPRVPLSAALRRAVRAGKAAGRPCQKAG